MNNMTELEARALSWAPQRFSHDILRYVAMSVLPLFPRECGDALGLSAVHDLQKNTGLSQKPRERAGPANS
jgi:hypothetical protein